MTFRGIPNWIPPPTPAQPGGLALGVNVFSALGDAGVFQTAVQWVYAPGISRDEFPPHRALAGEQFDFLPTPDGWYPGDHKGCLCHDEPILRSRDGRFVSRESLTNLVSEPTPVDPFRLVFDDAAGLLKFDQKTAINDGFKRVENLFGPDVLAATKGVQLSEMSAVGRAGRPNILINEKIIDTPEFINDAIKAWQTPGSTPGKIAVKDNLDPVEYLRRTIAHETGHNVNAAALDKAGSDAYHSAITERWNRHVREDAWRSAGNAGGGPDLLTSVYSLENHSEWVAECIADVATFGSGANPESLEVVRIIQGLLS